jgi:aldehyde dehydrogenase (NAD+)
VRIRSQRDGNSLKDLRFPPGVVNTVPSLGHVGGAALAAHMDVDLVAFTGSTVTGKKIMEAAARSNLKKVRKIAFA